jgi:hypothetical protein
MTNEQRDTHPHGQNTMPGSSLDKAQQRPSSPLVPQTTIGGAYEHYTPGIAGLGIMPNTVVQCPCGAWVHCDVSAESFKAQCCGTQLSLSDLADPVACSCHN